MFSNPLEIEQARAIDEVVKPTHRQRRLRFQSALGLNRRVAHSGSHRNVVFFVWWQSFGDYLLWQRDFPIGKSGEVYFPATLHGKITIYFFPQPFVT